MFYTVMKYAIDFVGYSDDDRDILRAMIAELNSYEILVAESEQFKSAKFILGRTSGEQERSVMIAEILASYKHHRELAVRQ